MKAIYTLSLLSILLFSSCLSRKAMVTPYEYALLSAHVYDTGEVAELPKHLEAFQDFDAENFKSGINVDIGQVTDMVEAEEWEELIPYLGLKLFAKGGYFGRAYVNEAANQLILAHRGTDIDIDSEEDAQGISINLDDGKFWDILNDLDDDYDIYYGNIPEQQFKAALAFTKKTEAAYLEKYGKKPEIIHTGHSLGAVLAELCAVKNQCRAVTFESPGTKPLVEKLEAEEKLNLKKVDITIYNAEPNSINTLHEQIGTVVPLYKQEKNTNKPGKQELAKALQYHSIKQLLTRFDPKSGKPR